MSLRRREVAAPTIKTAAELEAMRRSSRLARRVVGELGRRIAPGVTTWELELLARQLTADAGATAAFYHYRAGNRTPFPAYVCASVNEAVVHGIPDERPLEPGDIVSIDYGCVLDGWYGDTAYTWAVGEPTPDAAHLMRVTKESLAIGIAAAEAGRRVFDVAKAIQAHVESHGCGVVRNLVGHGIGRRLHEPPQVPNFAVTESRRDRLRPGMTICIEPMVTFGHYDVESLDDGWTEVTRDRSLAAHYEHTIAITDAGPPEVLSLPDDL